MQLMFLGTSAGRPTKSRNVTAAALMLRDPINLFWLFDAGEGTQHRMLGTKLKLNRLEKIFITHLHGDHIYGLPGLLSSRSYFEGAVPLELIGPVGIKAYIEQIFQLSGTHLEYEFAIREIEPGVVLDTDRYKVTADALHHRMNCLGYRIEEKDMPGPLNLSKLEELGLQPGPEYGRLKRGEDVQLENGRWIYSADVAGAPLKGRIVTILGDTAPCDKAIELARNADLLVHEATFAAGMEEKAEAYGHSTSLQAAQIARKAGAKRLVLTHFSSRLSPEDVEQLVASARTLVPDTMAADDLMEITIDRSRT